MVPGGAEDRAEPELRVSSPEAEDPRAVREVRSDDALYSDRAPVLRKCTATAIPYALWANRGKSEMLVWVRKIVDPA